jgi:sodium-dependent phosphate transporter
MSALEEYQWIYVLSAFAMIGATFGIGANDGANPWATPVGSGALTLRWAYALAAVCEITGAVGGGSPVAETIRKKIADVECFEGGENDAAILMWGSFCVLVTVGVWLVLASRYEMPVSTTHSAVCGMVGMAIAAKGSSCVVWYEPGEPDEWRIPQGFSGIILSWLFAPVLSLVASASLFWTVRRFILRAVNSFDRAITFYPILVFVAVTICAFFLLAKGMNKRICPKHKEDWLCTGGATRGEVAFGVALAIGLFAAIAPIPIFRKVGAWAKADVARQEVKKTATAAAAAENGTSTIAVVETRLTSTAGGTEVLAESSTDDDVLGPRTQSYQMATDANAVPTPIGSSPEPPVSWRKAPLTAARLALARWGTMDLRRSALGSKIVSDIHEQAEVFDPATEAVFCYIQIFTAMVDSLAHGANDVPNGVGPYMSVNHLYKTGEVESKAAINEDDAYAILAAGGAGIALGVSVMGWRMIRMLGLKMCKVTPSRGFAIELGAAAVLILGSYRGIPLSSTHCQIGATIGVALLDGRAGLNMRTVWVSALGLVSTMLVASLTAGILTSIGVYSPSAGYLHEITQETCTGIECLFNTTTSGQMECAI